MRARIWILIFAIAMLFLSAQCGMPKESAEVRQYNFEPTGESLGNYKVPQWYEDAKFGIYFQDRKSVV